LAFPEKLQSNEVKSPDSKSSNIIPIVTYLVSTTLYSYAALISNIRSATCPMGVPEPAVMLKMASSDASGLMVPSD